MHKAFNIRKAVFRLRERGRRFGVIGALMAVMAGCAQQASGAQDGGEQWVGTWGTAPQVTEARNLPPAPGLSSNTLRQVVHVSVGGKELRVRFSNVFGDGPLTIQEVHIALSAGGGAIKVESDRALMFQGKPAVSIPAGEMIMSDPLDFDLAPLSDVAVTIDFADAPHRVTGHPGSRATSWLQTNDAVSAADMTGAAKAEHWYILTGIDVPTGKSAAATVVAFGDSITDGHGSVTDKNNRWPDNLARLLQANGDTADVGVLNEGIGGNCVLRGGLGPTAMARLQRDVLDQDAVRWMIVLEGVNDIGGSRGTNSFVGQSLIAAYKQIIDQAHAKHIRVYGATILPFGGSTYFSPGHEAARTEVNDWIRTSGKFDAVIDFDAVTRDPAMPTRLAAAADSGDHLHPGVHGYELMAGAIDLKLFAK
jgi:lysophospholipase L1-like esterase